MCIRDSSHTDPDDDNNYCRNVLTEKIVSALINRPSLNFLSICEDLNVREQLFEGMDLPLYGSDA